MYIKDGVHVHALFLGFVENFIFFRPYNKRHEQNKVNAKKRGFANRKTCITFKGLNTRYKYVNA
jgi:hypothetical protein